jgi:hypothetical protein
MKLPALMLLLAAPGLWAYDWGGSVENSAAGLVSGPELEVSATEIATLRLWANWALDRESAILVKGNITNSYSGTYILAPSATNTVSADLDYFVYNRGTLWVGRTDFRDFSATLLNTKLDGVQQIWYLPDWDVKALVGTSAALFKSGSTIFISEDDVKDRAVYENWGDPATLWAPPRLVGDIEFSAPRWVSDQVFTFALAGQLDLRPGEAQDGDKANTVRGRRDGAPVSTAYLGAGGQGRVVGPLYWRAFAYGCGGSSLTPVGPIETVNTGSGTHKQKEQFQKWKSSAILAGMGGFDFTLLFPETNYLLLDLGVLAGSWDDDGPSPDQNLPTRPEANSPSFYTGWIQISQTAGTLIFNPQPVNMITTTFSASIKPLETVQLLSNTYAFIRPSTSGITESGLDPQSEDLFLGGETDLAVLWRPVSDVGASLACGLFVPNKSAMQRGTELKLQATVSASF